MNSNFILIALTGEGREAKAEWECAFAKRVKAESIEPRVWVRTAKPGGALESEA